MVWSLASHMISKGIDQSGGEMIGTETKAPFNLLKASKQASVNSKGTALTSNWVKGLAIKENFLMNRL